VKRLKLLKYGHQAPSDIGGMLQLPRPGDRTNFGDQFEGNHGETYHNSEMTVTRDDWKTQIGRTALSPVVERPFAAQRLSSLFTP
jgi:hypothetical protein